MIAAILAAGRLALAITSTWHVAPSRAFPAALAIVIEAAPHQHSPGLMAAIAVHETMMRPWLVGSRGECGPMQVKHYANARRLCALAKSDVFEAYRQGAAALGMAYAYCLRRRDNPTGTTRCAVRVYATGPRAAPWKSSKAEREIRSMWMRIEDAMSGPSALRRTGS